MKHVSAIIFLLLLSSSGLAMALTYTGAGNIYQLLSPNKQTWLAYLVYLQPFLLVTLYFSHRKHTLFSLNSDDSDKIASQADKILDAVSGCVITVNRDHLVCYINEAAEKLIGIGSESIGQPIQYVFNIQDRQGNAITTNVLKDQDKYPERNFRLGQVKLLSKQQGDRYINLSTRSILVEDDPQPHGIVLVFRDVTADRKVMNNLYRQASQDALTGLINRSSFERSLEHTLQTVSNSDINHCLVYIDLDHFKIVNDSAGHIAGDELLRQVALIFTRHVRQIDKVARMGGDEFAILLQTCSLKRAKNIVESILDDMRSFRFSWQEKSFVVGASIGIVEFNGGFGRSLKGLLNVADQACYISKKLGRDQYHILTMEKAENMKNPDLVNWKKQLEHALEHSGFSLMTQPIVPLQRERLDSIRQYEVLIRLEYKDNIYRPGSFMPAAERLGLTKEIDKWVIKQVLCTLSSNYHLKKDAKHHRLMINLSSQSIQDENFIDDLKSMFAKANIPPSMLGFEVSETVAVANFSAIKKLFNELMILGCSRVLDDFGSGFSSLSYLRELPVNYLKIDGAFVRNLASNDVDAAMVKAVSQVGKVMNLFSIAESVENEQTLEALRDIGVDFAQGYHCGKPVTFETFCSKLEKTENDSMLLET